MTRRNQHPRGGRRVRLPPDFKRKIVFGLAGAAMGESLADFLGAKTADGKEKAIVTCIGKLESLGLVETVTHAPHCDCPPEASVRCKVCEKLVGLCKTTSNDHPDVCDDCWEAS